MENSIWTYHRVLFDLVGAKSTFVSFLKLLVLFLFFVIIPYHAYNAETFFYQVCHLRKVGTYHLDNVISRLYLYDF
jgi:hypothetical protein